MFLILRRTYKLRKFMNYMNPILNRSASDTRGKGMKIPSIGMRHHQMWDIQQCHELY